MKPGDVLGILEYEETEYRRQARYKIFVAESYPDKEPVVDLKSIGPTGGLLPCFFPRLDKDNALALAVMLFEFATDEDKQENK